MLATKKFIKPRFLGNMTKRMKTSFPLFLLSYFFAITRSQLLWIWVKIGGN